MKYGEPWRMGTSSGAIVTDDRSVRTPYPVSVETPEQADAAERRFYGGICIGESFPTHLAERVIACVNALAGIDDPEAFVRSAKGRAK
jgi:hypothetical protein